MLSFVFFKYYHIPSLFGMLGGLLERERNRRGGRERDGERERVNKRKRESE